MTGPLNRRDFVKLASAGIVTGTALKTRRSSADSAESKLSVGLIGCGGRGVSVARAFQGVPNVRIAYVCEVDESRCASAASKLGVDARGTVADLRRVLDDPAVDAVIVATPDHWHAAAAILACDAGKHVYVEKPISHNLREGRLLIEAAQRNNVAVQNGTQCRSTRMMIEAIQQLREGLIGDILVAKCWNIQRRKSIGRGQDSEPPQGLDYDAWVGPAPMIPYRDNRGHNEWRWWYHFGTGDIGNDGVHDLDYARWGLGVETHPSRIVAMGGKFFFDDDQQFPDTQQVTFEYPGDAAVGNRRLLIYEQRLWSTNYPHHVDNGAEFYGTKGQMFLSRRGKIQVRAERNRLVELEIEPERQDTDAHVANFCEAVRQGAALNSDALTGHLSTSLCHLGNIATRLGRTLTFDPETEQFVGDDEACALVGRQYRDHWATPV